MNSKTALLLLALFVCSVIATAYVVRSYFLAEIRQETSFIQETPNPITQNQSTATDTNFKDNISIIKTEEKSILDTTAITTSQQSFLKKQLQNVPVSSIRVLNIWIKIPQTSQPDPNYSTVKAQVFIPALPKPAPLLVYGSGTTGIAQPCAPSLEDIKKSNIGNYYNQMVTLASLGYTVIFPDYIGYHDNQSSHPYFIADLEARVMAGVTEALSEVDPTSADFKSIFLAGYSQGGHAALATAVNSDLLATDKKIVGVIGYAPAFDVQTLLIESPRLAPYLVYAYSKYYDLENIEAETVLLPQHLKQLENDVLNHCVDTVYSFYPLELESIYTPIFLQALRASDITTVTPQFAAAIQTNQVNTWQTDVPIYIIQGETDPIVTQQTQKKNLKTFCKNGMNVSYTSLPNTNHFQTPTRGTLNAHEWMQNILNGRSVQNSCLPSS